MSQFLLATFPQVVRYCLPDFLSLLVLLTWYFVCYFHKCYIYYYYTYTFWWFRINFQLYRSQLSVTINFEMVNFVGTGAQLLSPSDRPRFVCGYGISMYINSIEVYIYMNLIYSHPISLQPLYSHIYSPPTKTAFSSFEEQDPRWSKPFQPGAVF